MPVLVSVSHPYSNAPHSASRQLKTWRLGESGQLGGSAVTKKSDFGEMFGRVLLNLGIEHLWKITCKKSKLKIDRRKEQKKRLRRGFQRLRVLPRTFGWRPCPPQGRLKTKASMRSQIAKKAAVEESRRDIFTCLRRRGPKARRIVIIENSGSPVTNI